VGGQAMRGCVVCDHVQQVWWQTGPQGVACIDLLKANK
jgi:hypothetical protein